MFPFSINHYKKDFDNHLYIHIKQINNTTLMVCKFYLKNVLTFKASHSYCIQLHGPSAHGVIIVYRVTSS